ncbi:MAG: hypothetical protein CL834_01940, partial [Crocinitomicaceae bacterium]|nr:hypothetical protein [Crocinitomicaceae bacterium]
MANTKRYWSGRDELQETEAFKKIQGQEFPEAQAVDEFLTDERLESTHTGRRDFLKFMGFSLTAATLAACETPVVKSIPYTNKPEEVTPGVANFYASTYYDGQDYVNVLVKTREGRPIFVKSNPKTGIGSANARVIASVLTLYDSARVATPMIQGVPSSWPELDKRVQMSISQGNRNVVLTNTVLSPSAQRAIALSGLEHIQYDAVDYGAFREAARLDYGRAAFPSYKFDQAKTVLSIGADFLGTFADSIFYEGNWTKTRVPENGEMSRLHVFETNMSLSGSNADYRTRIKPSEHGKVATALLQILRGTGEQSQLSQEVLAAIEKAANDLKAAGKNALVVAGSNDLHLQRVVNAINENLNAVGTTVFFEDNGLFEGSSKALAQLTKDMANGKLSTLIMADCNP